MGDATNEQCDLAIIAGHAATCDAIHHFYEAAIYAREDSGYVDHLLEIVKKLRDARLSMAADVDRIVGD